MRNTAKMADEPSPQSDFEKEADARNLDLSRLEPYRPQIQIGDTVEVRLTDGAGTKAIGGTVQAEVLSILYYPKSSRIRQLEVCGVINGRASRQWIYPKWIVSWQQPAGARMAADRDKV